MKRVLYSKLLIFSTLFLFVGLLTSNPAYSQFADFSGSGTSGSGTFSNPLYPNFTWTQAGASSVSVDGSESWQPASGFYFGTNYGDPQNEENLNIRVGQNSGSAGDPITETSILTVSFNSTMPGQGFAFAVRDIEVDQVLITAKDAAGTALPTATVASWFKEVLDGQDVGGTHVPKWDPTNAGVLGNDTPASYTVWDDKIIGSLSDNEAGVATFETNIPISELTIRFDNLSNNTPPSYHFYMAVNGALLPVELVDFSSKTSDDASFLNWTTASETNNSGFSIQRELAPGEFTTLGFVEGAGTTTEQQNYSFELPQLDPGIHKFRLKQIDFDGQFRYSEVLEVTAELSSSFFLSDAYPNPFNPESNISFNVQESQEIKLELYNALGKFVRTLYSGYATEGASHSVKIDGSGLSGGTYFVQISGKSLFGSKSIVLLK